MDSVTAKRQCGVLALEARNYMHRLARERTQAIMDQAKMRGWLGLVPPECAPSGAERRASVSKRAVAQMHALMARHGRGVA